jgi:hypothetical protein
MSIGVDGAVGIDLQQVDGVADRSHTQAVAKLAG